MSEKYNVIYKDSSGAKWIESYINYTKRKLTWSMLPLDTGNEQIEISFDDDKDTNPSVRSSYMGCDPSDVRMDVYVAMFKRWEELCGLKVNVTP